jgi:hypothetical protein
LCVPSRTRLPSRDPGEGFFLQSGGLALAAALLFAAPVYAQTRGEAEFATQGFYLGGTSQSLLDTTGEAARFRDFLPGIGILAGSVEGYGSQSGLEIGENFLELRGAPWLGQRWTVTGGDFRAPASMVEFPFFNIVTPEMTARGVEIQAARPDSQYTFFTGMETLSAGERVPYRILTPQRITGASAVRKIGQRLQIGGRFLQFSTSPNDAASTLVLFPMGRVVPRVSTFSLQAFYTPARHWKLYAEASQPLAPGERTLTSSLAGLAWESAALTFRANYVREGTLYFPLAGFFAGDRQGPFSEVRWRPRKSLEFFGSASSYRNNLEHDPAADSLSSTSTALGLTTSLPGKFSATGQFSTIGLSSAAPDSEPLVSHNQQINATLARTLGNHSLHFNWRGLRLGMAPAPQRQNSGEVEDVYHLKRIFLGAAVRLQQASGTEQRNTVYFRGSVQSSLGRLNLYANIEAGNDLANRTIFATNAYTTSVAGIGFRLSRDWYLAAEAFRNSLNVTLNPASIFVLQNGGSPISGNLAATGQWSYYFRVSRQIRWGGGLPTENLDQLVATAAPLTGTVEGIVRVRGLAGNLLATGIPVTLDKNRVALTSSDGRYRFDDVPEGEHTAALSEELPADFDPGAHNQVRLAVQPRHIARADFEVLPLAALSGDVTGPEGAVLEGIVIRLRPGDRYTTTATDGHFSFYNLHEGDFEVVLDPTTLAENQHLGSPSPVPAVVRLGSPVPAIAFSVTVQVTTKPVRKVLDLK